jgi:EAL domain-containing protein (putative c-di-GMP-specific phosphodiesterase class I)
MTYPRNRRFADLPPDAISPIDAAIAARDADVITMVEQAVRHKDALLAFQPIVRSQVQSSAAFYEGLIRLLDETGRVIPASQFMPQVENRELGREIDTLALKFGCRALHQVQRLRLSINMSARSIGYAPWMETLERWLKRDDSIGPRLILEITESSAMTVPELVIDFMDRLQMRGICFALDDFGAGFTALRYFKDFFFDVLKIDGQFIRGISKDEDNLALTRAMITIGHQFDMLTVAEMVETEADMKILCDLGVDCMQGYYFGAPTTEPPWLVGNSGRGLRAG